MSPYSEQEYETKVVTRTRRVIDGYKPTFNLERSIYKITAKPKYENLSWYDCHIVYILSKTEIRFFYLISKLKNLNWQERRRLTSGKWRMLACELKNEKPIKDAGTTIIRAFIDEIINPIHAKYFPNRDERLETQEDQN